jgi:hypothetical protein
VKRVRWWQRWECGVERVAEVIVRREEGAVVAGA